MICAERLPVPNWELSRNPSQRRCPGSCSTRPPWWRSTGFSLLCCSPLVRRELFYRYRYLLYLYQPRYLRSGRDETPNETNTPIMMKHFLYPILSYRIPHSILQACGKSNQVFQYTRLFYTYPIANICKYSNISMEPIWCDQLQPIGFLPIDQKTLTSTGLSFDL